MTSLPPPLSKERVPRGRLSDLCLLLLFPGELTKEPEERLAVLLREQPVGLGLDLGRHLVLRPPGVCERLISEEGRCRTARVILMSSILLSLFCFELT